MKTPRPDRVTSVSLDFDDRFDDLGEPFAPDVTELFSDEYPEAFAPDAPPEPFSDEDAMPNAPDTTVTPLETPAPAPFSVRLPAMPAIPALPQGYRLSECIVEATTTIRRGEVLGRSAQIGTLGEGLVDKLVETLRIVVEITPIGRSNLPDLFAIGSFQTGEWTDWRGT